MMIAILLLVLIFEFSAAEKPKNVRVVATRKATEQSEKSD
jgi:hypothetical protein